MRHLSITPIRSCKICTDTYSTEFSPFRATISINRLPASTIDRLRNSYCVGFVLAKPRVLSLGTKDQWPDINVDPYCSDYSLLWISEVVREIKILSQMSSFYGPPPSPRPCLVFCFLLHSTYM